MAPAAEPARAVCQSITGRAAACTEGLGFFACGDDSGLADGWEDLRTFIDVPLPRKKIKQKLGIGKTSIHEVAGQKVPGC
jgi:hypothetical protein